MLSLIYFFVQRKWGTKRVGLLELRGDWDRERGSDDGRELIFMAFSRDLAYGVEKRESLVGECLPNCHCAGDEGRLFWRSSFIANLS